MKKDTILRFLKYNFKLPLFILFLVLASYLYYRLYNLPAYNSITGNTDNSLIFFGIVLGLSFLIILKQFFDIVGLIFGQKAQDTLTNKAKK